MLFIYLSLVDSKKSQNLLEFIYAKYSQMMFSIANGILHNEKTAENIVHDSILIIIKNLDKFSIDDVDKNAKLIYIIVRNQAYNEYKRIKRIDNIEDVEKIYDESDPIEDLVITKELYEKTVSIIRDMDDIYSSVLMLKYNGYSNKEISSMLDISEDTVRQRLHRGREKIHKLLSKEMETDE